MWGFTKIASLRGCVAFAGHLERFQEVGRNFARRLRHNWTDQPVVPSKAPLWSPAETASGL